MVCTWLYLVKSEVYLVLNGHAVRVVDDDVVVDLLVLKELIHTAVVSAKNDEVLQLEVIED